MKDMKDKRPELCGVLVLFCNNCDAIAQFKTWEEVDSAQWYNEQTEHVSCPDCGPTYAEGVLAGEVTDWHALKRDLTRHIKARRRRSKEQTERALKSIRSYIGDAEMIDATIRMCGGQEPLFFVIANPDGEETVLEQDGDGND